MGASFAVGVPARTILSHAQSGKQSFALLVRQLSAMKLVPYFSSYLTSCFSLLLQGLRSCYLLLVWSAARHFWRQTRYLAEFAQEERKHETKGV